MAACGSGVPGTPAGRRFVIKGKLLKTLAALAAVLALLFSGCGGGTAEEAEFLEPGTQGTNAVKASRGIVSGDKLFVSMEKQINAECAVHWEVLGGEVTGDQVALMLETFRMYLQDALDGLTTDEASHGDLDRFLAETNEKAVEKLTNEQLFVSVEEASAERVEAP